MKNYISRITPSIGTDCIYLFIAFRGFPGGSEGKASACNVGVLGLIPGLGRSPGEGNGQPTPVLSPGEFHGQRSLVGYSPQGHKELDTTEQLHFHFLLLQKQITDYDTQA